jgi:hypothetical protein
MWRFAFAAGLMLTLIGVVPQSVAAAPWLFLSDIHFDPDNTSSTPSYFGADTNLALLRSTIAEMVRVDRAAPVVVITGDFLAHKKFDTPQADAVLTMLARRFDAAFPKAQFVIALGNEDSGCGDYAVAKGSPFLRDTAHAWAPLVNRNGRAPAFVRSFSIDGGYTTTLPIAHLTAVVIDDVFWAPRYRAGCGGTGGGDATFADLRRALREHGSDPKWLILHIPPGIDAYSTTHLVHHLLDVPFLDTGPRQRMLGIMGERRSHIALVVGAHTHKFSYRIVGSRERGPVPIFLVPSISPIFSNAPSFLTVDVRADGVITRADDHALLFGRWRTVGGTHDLGLRAVTGTELTGLQTRLAHDRRLRAIYARLYNAGAPPEINERNWHSYWCASSAFASNAYRACVGHGGGISILTQRGVSFVALVLIGAGVTVALTVTAIYLRRKRRVRPD